MAMLLVAPFIVLKCLLVYSPAQRVDGGALAPYIAPWTELMRLFLYLLALVVGFSPAQAGGLAMAEPVAVSSASQTASSAAQSETGSAHAAMLPVQMVRPQPVSMPTAAQLPVISSVSSELTDRPLE
jgi:hypothetical protein